jgi:hypothetical protein
LKKTSTPPLPWLDLSQCKPGDAIVDPENGDVFADLQPNGDLYERMPLDGGVAKRLPLKSRFKVCNLPTGFRELLRRARVKRAEKNLRALTSDWLVYSEYADPNNARTTLDEWEAVHRMHIAMDRGVARLTKKLYESPTFGEDDVKTLCDIIIAARDIGSFIGLHPIKRRLNSARASDAREPWWHEPAISRAMEIRQKHPDPKYTNNRISGDVYKELKDKQGGPRSVGAVYKALGRKLWTTGASPTK